MANSSGVDWSVYSFVTCTLVYFLIWLRKCSNQWVFYVRVTAIVNFFSTEFMFLILRGKPHLCLGSRRARTVYILNEFPRGLRPFTLLPFSGLFTLYVVLRSLFYSFRFSTRVLTAQIYTGFDKFLALKVYFALFAFYPIFFQCYSFART